MDGALQEGWPGTCPGEIALADSLMLQMRTREKESRVTSRFSA
jgi:hypothetical protein